MQIYLVGGAVRDDFRKQLGQKTLNSSDKDYVVVGASEQDLLNKGFVSVGKEFPVFVHPDTKEEYALARKEIKTGDKHTDFKFDFGPHVTLEEDLQRRDFTMNAVAFSNFKHVEDRSYGKFTASCDGSLYADPHNGLEDITNKVIRHVNAEHFVEDPLRVLRACRFAATLEFSIHPSTKALLKDMVDKGMLNHLTPERVWKEVEKVLKQAPKPSVFFYNMREIGALKILMPEVDALFDTPEQVRYHPTGNTGDHTMMSLDYLSEPFDAVVRFAVLSHDFGKAFTPKDELPSHKGHDARGMVAIEDMCVRMKIPNEYKDFALVSCKYHMLFFKFEDMNIKKIHDVLFNMTKFKSFTPVAKLCLVFKADEFGERSYAPEEEKCKLERFGRAHDRLKELFKVGASIKYENVPNGDRYEGTMRSIRLRQCRISEMKKIDRRTIHG